MQPLADGTGFDSSGPSGVRGDEFELDEEPELVVDSIDYDVYDDDDGVEAEEEDDDEVDDDEDEEDEPDLDEFLGEDDDY